MVKERTGRKLSQNKRRNAKVDRNPRIHTYGDVELASGTLVKPERNLSVAAVINDEKFKLVPSILTASGKRANTITDIDISYDGKQDILAMVAYDRSKEPVLAAGVVVEQQEGAVAERLRKDEDERRKKYLDERNHLRQELFNKGYEEFIVDHNDLVNDMLRVEIDRLDKERHV